MVRAFGCKQPMLVAAVVFVVLSSFLIPTSRAWEYEISDPLKIADVANDGLCVLTKKSHVVPIADNSGLVYLLWAGDQLDECDDGKFCDKLYLTVLDSGHEKETYTVELPAGEALGLGKYGGDLSNGWQNNTMYLFWSGLDSECTEDFTRMYYAQLRLPKQNPEDLEIVMHDTVTAGIADVGNGGVAIGSGGELHFTWADNRCPGGVFYRKWDGSSWYEGARICSTTWADKPTIVSTDCGRCTLEVTCCPRWDSTCVDTCLPSDTTCVSGDPLCAAGPSKLLRGSDGTVHMVWRITDVCQYNSATKGYPDSAVSSTPDIIFHRQIDENGSWSDTTRLSMWGDPIHAATVLPDDRLAVFWDDHRVFKTDTSQVDTSGIWYALKDPDSASFEDTVLFYYINDSTGYQPGAGSDPTSDFWVDSYSDTCLYFVFNDRTSVDFRRLNPNSGDVCSLTVVQPGYLDYTTKPRIAVDACGNSHVFYRYDDTEDQERAYYRKTVGDTASHCTMLAPNGGEEWTINSERIVRWRMCPGINKTVDSLKLFLGAWDSAEACAHWDLLDSLSVLARSYVWDVDVDAGVYKMKAVAYWTQDNSIDSCAAISENTFRVGTPQCPYLYVWDGDKYGKIGSVFGGALGESRIMEDWIQLRSAAVSDDGMLKAFITEEGSEISHVYEVSSHALTEEALCVLPGKGVVSKDTRVDPPGEALAGAANMRDIVIHEDAKCFEGDAGTTAGFSFDAKEVSDKGILVIVAGGKPPVNPDAASKDGPSGGILIEVDGARFVDQQGNHVDKIELSPRHDLDRFGFELSPPFNGAETVEFRMTWNSPHLIDFVGLAPNAEILPIQGAPAPLATELVSRRHGTREVSTCLPVSLAAGDTLFLAIGPVEKTASGPMIHLLSLTGYFEAGTSSIPAGVVVPMDLRIANSIPVVSGSILGTYAIPKAGDFDLSVFDVLGRLVATIKSGKSGAGIHPFQWDCVGASGRSVGSGVYFLRLESGGRDIARKVVIQR